jgi:hypothetical protein
MDAGVGTVPGAGWDGSGPSGAVAPGRGTAAPATRPPFASASAAGIAAPLPERPGAPDPRRPEACRAAPPLAPEPDAGPAPAEAGAARVPRAAARCGGSASPESNAAAAGGDATGCVPSTASGTTSVDGLDADSPAASPPPSPDAGTDADVEAEALDAADSSRRATGNARRCTVAAPEGALVRDLARDAPVSPEDTGMTRRPPTDDEDPADGFASPTGATDTTGTAAAP